MQVEVAFELEESSSKLEFPWESSDPAIRYLDLRENPGWLDRVEAARRHPALRNFLATVNSADSLFCTARCKTWLQQEDPASRLPPGTEPCEFASDIDLVFASEQLNLEHSNYDGLTGRLGELLTRDAPPGALRAELRVRPCRFRALGRTGFSLRILLYARGSTPEQAKLRWGLGLARIQQALMFTSRILRHQIAQAS